MNYDYYNKDRGEIVNYILGYLIFISIFFIILKIVQVSILASLGLYMLIIIISIIYIKSNSKYNLFKYDLQVFLLIYFFFSSIYLVELLFVIWAGNHVTAGTTIFIIISVLLTLNHYVLMCTKETKLKLIFLNYVFIVFANICIFSTIYINNVNITFDSVDNRFNHIQTFNHNPNQNVDVLCYDVGYKSILRPFGNIEDYILFCTSNILGGNNNGIIVIGKEIKYSIIFQKILFLILNALTIILLRNKQYS